MFRFPPEGKPPAALIVHIVLLALAFCSAGARADIYRSLDPATPTKYVNVLPTEGRWELYLKENPAPIAVVPEIDLRRFAVAGGSRYASQIQAAATANNVDAALIRAVITVESANNPSAVSSAGAVGLMQLMPETARRYNVTNRHDPGQNIHGGAQYLRDLLRMFDNNLHLALAAYNAGEVAVMKYGNRIPPYRETQAYVPKVMRLYKIYSPGNVQTAEQSQTRPATAVRGKGAQARIFRTYLVKPA